jgi:hypothetical protein
MAAATKMILSEKELLVFMEGAENSRSVLFQFKKRTEGHSQS